MRQCMEKVEKARRELKKDSDSKLKKVKELLKLEGTKGIHKKGGVLADPSAAMGLLWLRRGLEFWADVFEQEAKILGLHEEESSGRAADAPIASAPRHASGPSSPSPQVDLAPRVRRRARDDAELGGGARARAWAATRTRPSRRSSRA